MDTDFSRFNIGHRSLAFYFAKILGGHFAFIRQDSAECRQQETGKSESYWHAVRILALIIWVACSAMESIAAPQWHIICFMYSLIRSLRAKKKISVKEKKWLIYVIFECECKYRWCWGLHPSRDLNGWDQEGFACQMENSVSTFDPLKKKQHFKSM